MHRDTKLGLALAILVMGFAAALCFPRTPGEQTESLALQTAQELDSGIRLGQVKTYTDDHRPKPPVPEAVEVTPSVPVVETATSAPSATVVLPVESVPASVEAITQSEPTPVNPASLPPEVVVEEAPPVIPSKTYVVKQFETLSSIAKEQLGDAGRWREILNANRDLLTDERALRPKMVLVIPIPDGDEFTPPQGESFPVATSQPAETPSRVAPAPTTPNSVQKRFRRPVNQVGASAEPRMQ